MYVGMCTMLCMALSLAAVGMRDALLTHLGMPGALEAGNNKQMQQMSPGVQSTARPNQTDHMHDRHTLSMIAYHA